MLRASVIYKNSLEAARTFVVHDLAKTNNFPWLAAVSPIRSYVGSPIMDTSGKRRAVLCLCDTKPRPDIDVAQEFQMEQFAKLVMQILDNWALTRAIEDLEHGRQHVLSDKTGPPRKRDVTIVVTSIEGADALWKSIPLLMQDSQNIHNTTIRSICSQHWGYEFETEEGEEGEVAFAFHDPVDAVGFAVGAQKALHEADWPIELDHQPETELVEGAFRGLRVKMGIHHGRVETMDHKATGRVRYIGQTVSLAKSLCETARGGQILATFKTWDVASYFTGTTIGCPQVLDLGMHVIQLGDKNYSRDGVETARIVQLVPPNLAYDYFAARKLPSKESSSNNSITSACLPGRQFPLITSVKQVSASFHDAPYRNNKVTIAFVNMSAIDDRRVPFLINLIGFLLDNEKEFGGYQCKKEMLVFQRPVDAVLFGLRLQEELRLREPQADEATSLSNLIKFGCMHDYFVTMGPQRTTGRADYFGKAVNRAARLSSAATPGTICFGLVSDSGSTSNDPATGRFDRIEHPSIKTRFARKETFKGIRDEFDVYECERVGYM
jgi:class 3 adenylate cyclase